MSEREKRKLAAIMFTDMVAYSALTQQNEARALELLEEHRCLLRSVFPRYNGQEIKTNADEFLVEFGSAIEAVRCAIELQGRLRERNLLVPAEREIRIRVGVHVGDVVHREGDVYGDGVNIAKRVESLAEPGGICLSQQVFDQVRDRIEEPIVALGKRELKNIRTPVQLYRIVLPWEKKPTTFGEPIRLRARWKELRYLAVPLVIATVLAFPHFRRGVTARKDRTPAIAAVDKNRIAVLPFENISADPRDAYFAAGMTKALGTDLGKIRALRVVTPDSVEQYRKAGKTEAEIGRELGAGSVVAGSAQWSGDQVRVAVQLLNTTNGDQLWGERFDQKSRDLFAVQDRISRSVASALKLTLTPGEEKRLQKTTTRNPQAYDCYMRARFRSYGGSREEIDSRIQLLEKAVALDPAFAQAYAYLARAYGDKRFYLEARMKEWEEKAHVALAKALALDPELADAHYARGLLLWRPSMHFPHGLAIKEYRRALELNPNLDEARHALALVYNHIGLFDKARQELEQASEINPVDASARNQIGNTHYYEGSYAQAVAVLETCPSDMSFTPLFECVMFSSLAHLGRREEARARVRRFLSSEAKDEGGLVTSVEAILYALDGNQRQAEVSIQRAAERSRGFGHSHHTAYNLGSACALLKQQDQALRWLEQAANDGFPCYPAYTKDPFLDNLRSDPRFIAFLEKLKRDWDGYQKL